MSTRASRAATAAFLTGLLAACGGDSTAPATPTPPPAPLSLSAASLQLVPGERSTLGAAGTVQWRSEDPKVATVSATGEVSAVGAGSTTVVATRGSESARATVTVVDGGLLGPAGGTVATRDSALVLRVPAGAVAGGTRVEVTPVDDPTGAAAGAVLQIGPATGQLGADATIELVVADAKLPTWLPAESMRVGRLVNGRWELEETALVTVATGVSDAAARAVAAPCPPGGCRFRARVRSWGTYSVVNPCTPMPAGSESVAGSIGRADCALTTADRRSDYYAVTIGNGQAVDLATTATFVGLWGVKASSVEPQSGTVFGAASLGTGLRVIGNGAPLQLFVSGQDSAKVGEYVVTRSAAAEAYTCGTVPVVVVPGATFSASLTAANACATTVKFTSFPAALGKPILTHGFNVKLDAGVQYRITVGGFVGAFDPTLTVFAGGAVLAQAITAPGSVRSVTVSVPQTSYVFVEVSSGHFAASGAWVTPAGSYSMSVSR